MKIKNRVIILFTCLLVLVGCQTSQVRSHEEKKSLSMVFSQFIDNCVKEKISLGKLNFNSIYQPQKILIPQLDEKINNELLAKAKFRKTEERYRYRAIQAILDDQIGITSGTKQFNEFASLDFVYLIEDSIDRKDGRVNYQITLKVIHTETSSQICGTNKSYTMTKKELDNLKDNNSPPLWFGQLGTHSLSGIYYGYGKGKTLEEAKSVAIKEITEQTRGRKNDPDILRELKPEKQLVRNNLFYVAYVYDSRPLLEKVSSSFTKLKSSQTSGDLFQELPFSKKLVEAKLNPDYRLNYENQSWHLVVGKEAHSLNRSEWYRNFFIEKQNPDLKLSIQPKNNLSTGENYFIATTSAKSGYLSQFFIYEQGQVLALGEANRKISSSQKLVYPDPEEYDGLVAENLSDQKTSRDMVVVVFCRQSKASLNNYQSVSDENISDNDTRLYNYGQLLKDIAGCSWSSQYLTIAK